MLCNIACFHTNLCMSPTEHYNGTLNSLQLDDDDDDHNNSNNNNNNKVLKR